MAHLVHKVGVVFHAQDRLSRSLDKFGKDLTGLERKQKMFERAQRSTEVSTKRLEAAENKLASTRAKHAISDEKAATRRMQILAQQEAMMTRLGALEKKHAAERDAFIEQGWAKHDAIIAKQEAREAEHRTKYVAAERKALAEVEALRAKHAAANYAAGMQSSATANQIKKLKGRGFTTLDDAGLMAAQSRLLAHQASIARLGAERATAMRTSLLTEKGAPRRVKDAVTGNLRALTAVEMDALQASAARGYNKQISQLEKAAAAEEKRIVNHHKLLELEMKLVQMTHEQTIAVREQALAERKLHTEKQEALAELRAAQRAAAEAKTAEDKAELERWVQLQTKKLEGLEEQIVTQQKVATQQSEIHTRQLDMLEIERTERGRVLGEVIATNTALTEQLATEEAIAEVEATRVARYAALQTAYNRFSSGAAKTVGGLMGLGVLAWGGNHIVHQAAEYQGAKNAMKYNIYGQKNKAGQLWSDILTRDVEKGGGFVNTSAGKLQFSRKDVMEMLLDQLSTAITPEHAREMLPEIAKMTRYGQIRGMRLKDVSRDLPVVYERMGATKHSEIVRINDQIARGMAISNRLTIPALKQTLEKPIMTMRNLNMDMAKTIPTIDYSLSLFDPAKAGTQIAAFIETIQKGGANEKSRKLIDIMSGMGYFKRGKERVLKDFNGKVLKDGKGHPMTLPGAFDFGGMGLGDVATRLADRLVQHAGGKDVLHATPQQRTVATQEAQALLGKKEGMRWFMSFLDPKERRKMATDMEKYGAAPGLDDQLKGKSNLYAANVETFKSAWSELMVTLGEQWLPGMTGFVQQATETANGITAVMKKYEWLAPAILSVGTAIATLAVVAGIGEMLMGVAMGIKAIHAAALMWTLGGAGASAVASAGGGSLVAALVRGGSLGAGTATATIGTSGILANPAAGAAVGGGLAAGLGSIAVVAAAVALGGVIGWNATKWLMDYFDPMKGRRLTSGPLIAKGKADTAAAAVARGDHATAVRLLNDFGNYDLAHAAGTTTAGKRYVQLNNTAGFLLEQRNNGKMGSPALMPGGSQAAQHVVTTERKEIVLHVKVDGQLPPAAKREIINGIVKEGGRQVNLTTRRSPAPVQSQGVGGEGTW